MKLQKFFLIGLICMLASCETLHTVTSGITVHGISNSMPVTSGTYFIVNAQNSALTPLDGGPGQNVFLRPFNRSGMQQWVIAQAGTKNNPSYTIRLNGETDGLWMQGYPVKDHTPIIGSLSKPFTFKIVPVPGKTDCWFIKSNHYGGDAMHSFVFSSELPTEIRFDPVQDNAGYMWRLERVGLQ